MKIKEYLQTKNIITDGAFGTYYADKFHTSEIPELANITDPEQVKSIHRDYILSGANLIRTNTFAANTIILEKEWEFVEQIIKAAVKIAQEAVDHQTVFISGDIGPIPFEKGQSIEYIEEEYYKIAQTFIKSGCEIINFETFESLDHIKTCIKRIKADYDVTIMLSFSVNQYAYSTAGLSAKRLIAEANKIDELDVIGLNCGVGPAHLLQIIENLEIPEHKYFLALPNAGYPTLSRSQLQYGNNPQYFADKMKALSTFGVDILGGCCGTNPKFIEEMKKLIDTSHKIEKHHIKTKKENNVKSKSSSFILDEGGQRKHKKIIAVELAPPFNVDDEKLLEAAHILKNADVDVLTFPDSPSGRTRVDSVLMAEKVKRETGIEVMPHICCRDKNAVAIRSLFMGAHINNINNLLIITGDPLPSSVRQSVKAVFNFDSVGLMKIVDEMNQDVFSKQSINFGGAINQGRDLENEIKRIQKKMDVGAQFFLTQPVFSDDEINRLRIIKERTNAFILCGIMPLVNKKNALFMKNEISGIHIPDEIINQYPDDCSKSEGEKIGVRISQETMKKVDSFVDGYYFSFPFNRVHLLEKILSEEQCCTIGCQCS